MIGTTASPHPELVIVHSRFPAIIHSTQSPLVGLSPANCTHAPYLSITVPKQETLILHPLWWTQSKCLQYSDQPTCLHRPKNNSEKNWERIKPTSPTSRRGLRNLCRCVRSHRGRRTLSGPLSMPEIELATLCLTLPFGA